MTDAPFLLLIGAGGNSPEYREFVLSRIAAAHRVVLVDAEVPAWTRPYLTPSHPHVAADLTDTASVAAAVKEFAASHPISGVMTYMEHHVLAAAEVAQQLGLPTSTPEAITAARDKALTRRLLDEHQVPSALARQAVTAEQAVALADEIGYPVVVKPRSEAGSAGVIRATTAAEVEIAYQRAATESVLGAWHGPQGVLVEEWLDGAEISVETAVLGPGNARILAVTRKESAPINTTQEYGHVICASDPLLHDGELAAVVSGAVSALGLTCGVLCIELMLTSTGPRVVEVNARLGGDLLPLLAYHALGIDLAQVAAALATGAQPDLKPSRKAAAGIRFAYPDVTGVLERLTFPAGVHQLPYVERAVLSLQPPTYVSAPPLATLADRLAHWVVVAQDATACRFLLADVALGLDVSITPPVHAASCTR
ncbi:ATP-grasp domain-containing protein [Streptomyces longwoodensis]|uniref:ATP-grasp domain-containing protein n=1 Tax=Streptomyces longwoodensis TaxID=68231 RepID=UPI0033C0B9C5